MDEKRYKVLIVKDPDGRPLVPNKTFELELNKFAIEGWRLHSYSHCCADTMICAVLVNDNV